MFLSILILALSGIVDYVVSSTDRWDGFLTGGLMVLFFGPLIWGIFVLPLNLLVWGIYKLAKWHRFRTAWLLAPSLAMTGLVIGNLIVHPPTAEGRFFHTTGVIFPRAEVSGLVCSFTPDTWADGSEDHYVFTCGPEVTERLIRDLRMSEGGDMDFTTFRDLPGGLTADAFADAAYYKAIIREGWTCYLKTDATRSRVYIVVWSI